MARWKELPDSLDSRVRQLVVQLRRLKDHSGLGLASLAAKTSYSRSSWERYLNGKALPPREAVEELARVCGAEPTRLLVLHEVAAEAWPQEPREGAAPPGEADELEGGAPRKARRTEVIVGAVIVVVAALAVGLLAAEPWEDDAKDGVVAAGGREPGEGQRPFVFKQGRDHPCRVVRKDGALGAGYSATRETLMDLKSSGWEVLEAQCLLRHHGYDPGIADGSYGPNSKSAATRFQKDHKLPPDGIVGPDTWGVLRR